MARKHAKWPTGFPSCLWTHIKPNTPRRRTASRRTVRSYSLFMSSGRTLAARRTRSNPALQRFRIARRRTKGATAGTRSSSLFKLGPCAEKNRHRIRGFRYLVKGITGQQDLGDGQKARRNRRRHGGDAFRTVTMAITPLATFITTRSMRGFDIGAANAPVDCAASWDEQRARIGL